MTDPQPSEAGDPSVVHQRDTGDRGMDYHREPGKESPDKKPDGMDYHRAPGDQPPTE